MKRMLLKLQEKPADVKPEDHAGTQGPAIKIDALQNRHADCSSATRAGRQSDVTRHAELLRCLPRPWWRIQYRCLMINRLARIVSWLLLAAIVVLSLVPPGLRPVTSASHNFEHAGIFLLTGIAFAVGYRIKIGVSFPLAIAFCAVLESLLRLRPRPSCTFERLCSSTASRHALGLRLDCSSHAKKR